MLGGQEGLAEAPGSGPHPVRTESTNTQLPWSQVNDAQSVPQRLPESLKKRSPSRPQRSPLVIACSGTHPVWAPSLCHFSGPYSGTISQITDLPPDP